MRSYSNKELKILELATVGGMTAEEAYFEVFKPSNRKIGMTNYRRKENARPDLFEKIRQYKRGLLDVQYRAQREAAIELAKKNALDLFEKRDILRKIIVEESTDDEFLVVKGEVKQITRRPRINEKLRAIDLDNKIAGHYSPEVIKHDATDVFVQLLRLANNKQGGNSV